MIKFRLFCKKCSKDFDSWFASSKEYEKLKKSKLLNCPKCIENNFDYVGNNFAYEARSIHYNNKKREKGIYGNASKKEVDELLEEGIDTEIIPWVNDKEN